MACKNNNKKLSGASGGTQTIHLGRLSHADVAHLRRTSIDYQQEQLHLQKLGNVTDQAKPDDDIDDNDDTVVLTTTLTLDDDGSVESTIV